MIQRWQRIDILVNNAAVAEFGPFGGKTLEQIRREFEVNYFGYVRMISAVLPYMKAQGDGIIHNMGSEVGITGFPGLSGYASSKGAIEALTRTLSLEFARYDIKVNLMHPPLTNTKSAAPLGIPPQAMADPVDVGRKLAKQILSAKPIIAPDPPTAVGLLLMRLFPNTVGKLLSRLAERGRRSRKQEGSGAS